MSGLNRPEPEATKTDVTEGTTALQKLDNYVVGSMFLLAITMDIIFYMTHDNTASDIIVIVAVLTMIEKQT